MSAPPLHYNPHPRFGLRVPPLPEGWYLASMFTGEIGLIDPARYRSSSNTLWTNNFPTPRDDAQTP